MGPPPNSISSQVRLSRPLLGDSPGGWHSHGDLFVDTASEIALVPLTVLQDLLDGSLLVSVAETSDGVVDISIADSEERYDLTDLGEGEKQTFIGCSSRDPI